MSATVAPAETTLPVEELSALHAALARSLGEVGKGGSELAAYFENQVSAQCLGCGIRIKGSELGHLAVGDGQATLNDPRLERLLGYCARNGCNVKLYRVVCESTASLNAPERLARALELRSAPPPDATPTAPPAPRVPWWKDSRRRLRGILVILVVAVVFRALWNRGLIPGLPKKPSYKPVPSSTREAL